MTLEITGGEVLIDEEDLELVQQFKWHVSDTGYAVWRGIENGAKKTVRMHRLIAGTPAGLETDHLNGDRLDNRRRNLRICAHEVNAANRHGTKGYTWDASRDSWLVQYHRKFYGRYATEEEARRAYQMAKSGVERGGKRHPRRRLLPRGVYYMKPNERYGKPYYCNPQRNGKRTFMGYFGTAQEAEVALTNFLSKEDK